MTRADARKLPLGLYKIFWKEGGYSLAACGQRADGEMWMAPVNWIHIDTDGLHWAKVKRVELIAR